MLLRNDPGEALVARRARLSDRDGAPAAFAAGAPCTSGLLRVRESVGGGLPLLPPPLPVPPLPVPPLPVPPLPVPPLPVPPSPVPPLPVPPLPVRHRCRRHRRRCRWARSTASSSGRPGCTVAASCRSRCSPASGASAKSATGSGSIAALMKSCQICGGERPAEDADAVHVGHGAFGAAVSDPHRRDELRCVADEPGVAVVLRRPGLARLGPPDVGGGTGALCHDAAQEHR